MPSSLRPLLLVVLSVSLGVAGLLLWRAALVEAGGFSLGANAVHQLINLAMQWKFWLGSIVLAGVVLISLELYGQEELSRVVPMYSISYVLIAVVGKFWLGENLTAARWIGIAVVLAGVTILVRS